MTEEFPHENDLVNAVKHGNHIAFEHLLDKYHHELSVYAFSLTRKKVEAEDIIQNVFLNLWKKRQKLDSNLNIRSLLYKSVYNEFVDHYRKHRNLLQLEVKQIEVLQSLTDDNNEKNTEELIALVRREIEKLPEKSKEVFLLSKQEGLTNKEIAEHLNTSLKSVEAHMTKAFSILRKKLKFKIENILFLVFKEEFMH
ncbi:RNA polymerase sigma factor [Robertkochia solimangrovi]|uniref:RNA polymerase sigma factor n=1 Tax=Robertkochia solimangrovi TaxID=2213046 RepID=UPI0011805374|nr:RNA polymerase sigma-70 factor [Robertkochia solimangrovi]TRZ45184.1 RNA polymerase sigma-70 factor [Robertkochia solimangrovi]